MKVEFTEYDDCFEVAFEAETVAETLTLVRFGLGAKKDLRWTSAYAFTSAAKAYINIGKRKEPFSEVKP